MTSYRVDDVGFALPEHVTTRGIEGRAVRRMKDIRASLDHTA